MSAPELVLGNYACARGAIAAGCRFFAGYPITPSSEVMEEMARLLPGVDGVFVQMEDEMASLAAAIGASLGGTKAMTATSGPGFSLMQEHIGFAAIAEVPVVIVNVMRVGPSTGRPTSPSQGDVMQARWGSHGDRPAIVLAPASVEEVFELTVRAFDLAERFRTPTVVLFDEVIGHIRESARLPESVATIERRHPDVPPEDYLPKAAGADGVPPLPAFGDGYRFHITGLVHDERGFPTTDAERTETLIQRLHDKVDNYVDEIIEVEEFMLDDAETAIFAFGVVARAAREAVLRARAAGLRVGMIRPRTIWPFPTRRMAAVARQVDRIVVAEMNWGQLVHEVERAAAGAVEVVSHRRVDGEAITPRQLESAIRSAHTAAAVTP